MIRALAPDTSYPTDSGVLFFFAQLILGQTPFYWPTPDGYPDTQSYWANTGGLLNRWRLSFFSFAPYIPDINVSCQKPALQKTRHCPLAYPRR
jgi:uncharacterized protein (DUF1800 family)